MTNRIPLDARSGGLRSPCSGLVVPVSPPAVTPSHSPSPRAPTALRPTPPVRLTLNHGHDGEPGLARRTAPASSTRRGSRRGTDRDVCLAELPASGGSQRRLVCDVPGRADHHRRVESTAAARRRHGSPSLSAGNGGLRRQQPGVRRIADRIHLGCREPRNGSQPPLHSPRRRAPGLCRVPPLAGPSRLVYVGQRFGPSPPAATSGCPLDTLFYGTEVTLLDLADGRRGAA